ncbi:hypothetical protein MCEMSEM29_01363 [Methylophilaceae bacterium]
MNTYKATVKVSVTKTVTKSVEVLAGDADKAKIQLEAMYGRKNVLSEPKLIYTKC